VIRENKINRRRMIMRIRQFVLWAVGLVCLVIGSVNAQADPIVVNCDQGQSLNRTLARMIRPHGQPCW
jgi:hypothetical protein